MKKKDAIITLINRALPNICIIMACMILTFLVINEFNTAMQFVTNRITLTMLYALMGLIIWSSVLIMHYQRKLYKARTVMKRMQEYINDHLPDEETEDVK